MGYYFYGFLRNFIIGICKNATLVLALFFLEGLIIIVNIKLVIPLGCTLSLSIAKHNIIFFKLKWTHSHSIWSIYMILRDYNTIWIKKYIYEHVSNTFVYSYIVVVVKFHTPPPSLSYMYIHVPLWFSRGKRNILEIL